MTWKIVDDKIQKAIQNGDFDNLDGTGKPLDLDYLKDVPEDVRMAYTILKNANMVPPEMELKKEIHELERQIAEIPDGDERRKLQKKLTIKMTEYALVRESFR